MDKLLNKLRDLGITPENSDLYQTAFTHRSFLNESKQKIPSNERLEFLGDAVLQFIISKYIYLKRAEDPEGELTNLRAYIVKTDSLAKVSRNLELGSLLRLSKGEEISGGRDNTQILANTFEALIGATFLDLGLEAAQKLIENNLIPLFEKEIESGAPKDSKSMLQELVQSKFQVSPKYRILATSGPDHAKQFTVGVFVEDKVLGQGEGSNKQTAEELAAKEALKTLA